MHTEPEAMCLVHRETATDEFTQTRPNETLGLSLIKGPHFSLHEISWSLTFFLNPNVTLPNLTHIEGKFSEASRKFGEANKYSPLSNIHSFEILERNVQVL